MNTQVAIIGAGLAGLAAARRLADSGIEVLVLEARERVGGRTEGGRTEHGDATLELGGQWLGPGQTRMYELVTKLGLSTFPTYNNGHHVVMLGDSRSLLASHRGAVPKLNPFVLADIAQGVARLERLARTVPLDAPWHADRAVELDAQTFHTWIRRTLRTATGREYFRLATEAVFAAGPADLSTLHAAFYVRAGAGFENLISVDRGAQQDRVVGGTVAIAEALAALLGDRVLLDHPVSRIAWGDDRATITTRSGTAINADRVIVAIPPTLTGRLDYQPALPSWRDQLTQRVPAGSVVKCFCVYDRPFWRDSGLTGQAVSDTGPIKITFDNSPPDGTPGILLGFLEGDDARRMVRIPAERRRQRVIESMVRFFGPQAADPIEYHERDWSAEEFSRGCYGAHFTTGTWTSFGHALRAPIGPIHWAGTECALEWSGYMEGAVRSGEATADHLIAAFS